MDANGDKLSETNVLLSNGRPNCTRSRLGKAIPNLSLNNSGVLSLANFGSIICLGIRKPR